MIPRLEQISLDAITKLKQISLTLTEMYCGTRLCGILPSPARGEGNVSTAAVAGRHFCGCLK
jgi:hypothetical protein